MTEINPSVKQDSITNCFFAVRWFPLSGMSLEKSHYVLNEKGSSLFVANIYFSFSTNLNAGFPSRKVVCGDTLTTNKFG